MFIFLVLSQLWMPAAAAPSPLEGSWLQACQNKTTRHELFVGAQVMLAETYFYDPACTRPFLLFKSVGTHQENGERNMDFRFSRVLITLSAQELVDDYNSRRVCGFQDWSLNQEKEITGQTCALFAASSPGPIPKKDEMRFGIYKLDGDHLYFGQLNRIQNALTPKARPTAWDPRFYIKNNTPAKPNSTRYATPDSLQPGQ
jgi:hypothetical protein